MVCVGLAAHTIAESGLLLVGSDVDAHRHSIKPRRMGTSLVRTGVSTSI